MKGSTEKRETVLAGRVAVEALCVWGSTDLPYFVNTVTFLSGRVGGGSRPPNVSSFSTPSLGQVSWEFVAYLCGVTCFQNCTEGESEIWLQKVIWQFIFRAALIPAAFFKLNLWHQDIHHFNCMLLFSQAQICFIFFFPFFYDLGCFLFLFFFWSTV